MELLIKGKMKKEKGKMIPLAEAQRRKGRMEMVSLVISFIFLLTGCSSIVQKSGEVLEGSSGNELVLSLYRSGGGKREAKIELRELRQIDGTVAIEIKSSAWPGFTLRGGRPGGSGNFDLGEVRILSSHVHGWNEFTLDIQGKAIFDDPKKTGGVLYITGEAERFQISSGKIRLKNNYLSGTAALSALRNRRERILALTDWMADWLEKNEAVTVFIDQEEFENYWKSRLYPELVSKSKRPPEYSAQNARWKKSDSIKWNLDYTEFLFPEELWEYRNSGALLRDWEEALPWIYMEYSWDYIISSFNNANLIKIR